MSRLASLGLVLVLLIVFTVGGASSTKPVKMEFYSAASQIIPLLFIVLAIEVRIFRLPSTAKLRAAWSKTDGSFREDEGANMFMIGIVMSMVLVSLLAGEYWALRPLSTGDASDGSPQIVRTTLGLGFVCISYVAVFAERDQQRAA